MSNCFPEPPKPDTSTPVGKIAGAIGGAIVGGIVAGPAGIILGAAIGSGVTKDIEIHGKDD